MTVPSREKPIVKKRYARIKQTPYSFRDGRTKISIRPFEFFEVDVSRAWFWSRVPEDARMGELILGEGWLTITFRYEQEMLDVKDVIAWDLNMGSMDGFNPELGWIHVDLRWLFHTHRVYEIMRQRLQELSARKPSMKRVLERYSRRKGNHSRDFVEKLTTEISRRFPEYEHIFEDIDKPE